MPYNCEIQEQPARPTLSARRRASVHDLPRVLGQTYSAIVAYLGELGQQPAGPSYAAYYNMDMQDLDIEIGFVVSEPLPGSGEIRASEIPGGRVATCPHIGPYGEIAAAYTALTQYVREHGGEPTGVAYELYLNDPGQTPPQELQTLVLFPLKPTG